MFGIPGEIVLLQRIGRIASTQFEGDPLQSHLKGSPFVGAERKAERRAIALDRRGIDRDIELGFLRILGPTISPRSPSVSEIEVERAPSHRIEIDQSDDLITRRRVRTGEEHIAQLQVAMDHPTRKRFRKTMGLESGLNLPCQSIDVTMKRVIRVTR